MDDKGGTLMGMVGYSNGSDLKQVITLFLN